MSQEARPERTVKSPRSSSAPMTTAPPLSTQAWASMAAAIWPRRTPTKMADGMPRRFSIKSVTRALTRQLCQNGNRLAAAVTAHATVDGSTDVRRLPPVADVVDALRFRAHRSSNGRDLAKPPTLIAVPTRVRSAAASITSRR